MMHHLTLQQMAEQSTKDVNAEMSAACAEVTELKIVFNHIMLMSKGFILGIDMLPSVRGNMAVIALDKGK
jgi:hypothetical protein